MNVDNVSLHPAPHQDEGRADSNPRATAPDSARGDGSFVLPS